MVMLGTNAEVEKSVSSATLPNFIVGGTLKAGTSSAYRYLSDHPQVCGSSVKETHFFENDYKDDLESNIESYSRYFEHYRPENKIIMEATPAYMANASEVAPRMRSMLPDVKLLFILRDPVDRFYSYYNFHIGRLTSDFFTSNGKREIGIDEYIKRCLDYSDNAVDSSRLDMEEWFLRALEIGRYAHYLKKYYSLFPREHIKVMFFEDMKHDARAFMGDLCRFLKIDPEFYDDYTFGKVNATFESRVKFLHHTAKAVNEGCDGFFQRFPVFRSAVVAGYRFINKKEGYSPIPDAKRSRLQGIYDSSNRELRELLNSEKHPQWLT